MSNDLQQYTPFDGYGSDMVEYSPNTALARPTGAPAEMPMQGGMVKKIHHSLRGRYWIGMVVGTLLGIPAGILGYRSQQPIYRAEGLIQIAHAVKPVNIQNTADSTLPDFEEYLQSQAMMIASRSIIDAAMQSDFWKAKNLPNNPEFRLTIATNLTVEHPSRTEMIRVYYTDKNAELSGQIIQAIIEAYKNDALHRSQMADTRRISVLGDRLTAVMRQIRNLNDDITAAANQYGAIDLGPMVEAKMNDELKIESRLRETEFVLESAKRKKDAKQAIADLNEDQIAMLDQPLRLKLAERDQIAMDIRRLKTAGVLPENSRMKQLESVLEGIQNKVDKYVVDWKDLQMRISDDPSMVTGNIPRMFQLSEKVLQGEVDALTKRFADVKKERTELGRQMIAMQNLQRQLDDALKDKQETQARMNSLLMENNMGGRLSVVNPGDEPLVPYKDRRKMFCAAGVLGGFGLPMGILMLIGLMDKRYRYSDETNEGVSNVPLLGILPRLPEKLNDPEQAAVAAHCIHQIRIMLQVGQNPDKRRTFMVTSASTGDGKTSLTMALGLSFAASGSKGFDAPPQGAWRAGADRNAEPGHFARARAQDSDQGPVHSADRQCGCGACGRTFAAEHQAADGRLPRTL
jgi:succinoglycan biosynthesis transport protein ExoP